MALVFLAATLLVMGARGGVSEPLYGPGKNATPQDRSTLNGITRLPCTCRFQGINYKLGATACIKLPGKSPRQALCVMSLNNTIWKFFEEPCDRDRPTS